jgi:Methylaspartate ammonia-lyase N-terminus
MVLIDAAHIRAAHGHQSRHLDVTVGKIEVTGKPESDGFLCRSTPRIGLVLASGEVARGDMMSVQYAGASGRDPVFRAAVVQPRLAGLDGREFRAMWRWSRTTTGGCRSLSSMAWDRGAHDQGALLPPHR